MEIKGARKSVDDVRAGRGGGAGEAEEEGLHRRDKERQDKKTDGVHCNGISLCVVRVSCCPVCLSKRVKDQHMH